LPISPVTQMREALLPPMSASAPQPPMPGTLFGRDADLDMLAQMLEQHRLITVIGAGGIGKTSLVVQALRLRQAVSQLRGEAGVGGVGPVCHESTPAGAAQSTHSLDEPAPAVLVELAPITDPSLLPGAIAQALRLPLSGRGDPLAGLVQVMQALRVLLVLDNAEHLASAVADLAAAVILGAPGVQLLVTSQVALRLPDERLLRLGPLAVPRSTASVADAMQHGSVALFVDQVRASDQRFSLNPRNVAIVVQLCRQLDGVALALKLAAARVSFLGLQGLQDRLAERLRLLSGGHHGAPTRQQTLMAALDWSHSLLDAPEQIVFRRLAVCVGGFNLELACKLAADDALDDLAVVDILSALVDRSLIEVDTGETPRYRLLESTREYAWLRLRESGEEATLRQRHAHIITQLFEQADTELWHTPDPIWLARYTPELDNARAALDWAVRQEDPMAVSLMAGLARLLFQWPLGHETRRRSDAVLPLMALCPEESAQARYWVRRSYTLWGVDQDMALECARRSATLHRRLGADPVGLHEALHAMVVSQRLKAEEMKQVLAEMALLAQPNWPARIKTDHQMAHVLCFYVLGMHEPMLKAAQEGLAVARAASSRLRINILQWHLCTALRCLGRSAEALAVSRASIEELGPWRGWSAGYLLGEYIWACLLQHDLAQAKEGLAEFVNLTRNTGWTAFGYNSHIYPQLALAEGHDAAAAQLVGFADRCWRRIGSVFPDMQAERERVVGILSQRLDAGTLQGLMTLGESLDEASACALLQPPEAAHQAKVA
jgi:predicted ATPase